MDAFGTLLFVQLIEKVSLMLIGCFLAYLGYKHRCSVIQQFKASIAEKSSDIEVDLAKLSFRAVKVDASTIFFLMGVAVIVLGISKKVDFQYNNNSTGVEIGFRGMDGGKVKMSTLDLIKHLNAKLHNARLLDNKELVGKIEDLKLSFARNELGDESIDMYLKSAQCLSKGDCSLVGNERKNFYEVEGWINAKF